MDVRYVEKSTTLYFRTDQTIVHLTVYNATTTHQTEEDTRDRVAANKNEQGEKSRIFSNNKSENLSGKWYKTLHTSNER